MFEVAPVIRKDPETPGAPFGRRFPIIFEEDTNPTISGPITYLDTRDAAEALAEELNAVLTRWANGRPADTGQK